jgi:hypothetical protein
MRPHKANCRNRESLDFSHKHYCTAPEQTATLNFQDRCLKPLGHPEPKNQKLARSDAEFATTIREHNADHALAKS